LVVEFQQRRLGVVGRADAVDPRRVDLDMTGCARADPAAGPFDAVDLVLHRRRHQGAGGCVDDGLPAVRGGVNDARHESSSPGRIKWAALRCAGFGV
jgi:hypothetical protein